jgi:uncharacterized protein YrrD
MQNAAVAAGKISLLEIRSGFLPADCWSNRHIPAANSFVDTQKSQQCTNPGEIHKFA